LDVFFLELAEVEAEEGLVVVVELPPIVLLPLPPPMGKSSAIDWLLADKYEGGVGGARLGEPPPPPPAALLLPPAIAQLKLK
jgi:hypothetical protein